jgi:hypothetical protein
VKLRPVAAAATEKVNTTVAGIVPNAVALSISGNITGGRRKKEN